MPYLSPSFDVYFGPSEVGAPDPLEDIVLEVIEGARDSLVVATQQLEHASVLLAILAARRRGVDVRVLLERDYLLERRPAEDPLAPGGDNERNREVLSALMRARVAVRLDRTRRLQHTNVLVADDGDDSRAVVVFGSANLTPTGLHKNLNHIVRIRDPAVAGAFVAEFDGNWSDRRDSPHGATPLERDLDGIRLRLVFGPDHGPELEVMKQIVKARERVDFSVFTFSGTSALDDAFINARRLGMPVRGVIDGRQGSVSWAATPRLQEAGVELYLSTGAGGVRKLHHKLVVVDRSVVVLGTFNFTRPAARLNDEALLVFGQQGSGGPQQELADFARAEIDRIVGANAKPA